MDTQELPDMQWINANTGEPIDMNDPEIIEFRQGKIPERFWRKRQRR